MCALFFSVPLFRNDYSQMEEIQKLSVLESCLNSQPPSSSDLQDILEQVSSDTKQSVQVLQAVGRIAKVLGLSSIGSYVISMARSASNVVEVCMLAWIVDANLLKKGNNSSFQRMVTSFFVSSCAIVTEYFLYSFSHEATRFG